MLWCQSNQNIYFQTSLEYLSLLTGLGPSMPDVEEEEVDSGRSFFPVATTASAPVTTSSHSDVAVVGPSDDDEFLPTADRSQLLLDELDDEEENSSLCELFVVQTVTVLINQDYSFLFVIAA